MTVLAQSAPPTILLGRAPEQAILRNLLDDARNGRSGVIVIRGAPGIGKSALIADAVADAEDMRCLFAAGVESESGIAFAALHRLLRPIFASVHEVPAPQAAALRSALGMTARGGDDPFLVGAGVLSLLAIAADESPLLCVVEDAHWLDVPSRDALLFAARRLDAEPIALIAAARERDPAFESAGLPELQLEGLQPEAAEALLAERFPEPIATGPRDRLIESAGGNPLALLELPLALTEAQRAGNEAIPELIPITDRIENIYLRRSRSLCEQGQLFIAVAAADNSGDPAVVRRASDALGIETSAIDAVEATGLLRVGDKAFRWRHPLVRSAAYHYMPFARRRQVHLALAAALTHPRDRDRRALQLADAAEGLDETLAAELERSAAQAQARGGFASAATVLARSASLTPDDETRARRLVAAAQAEAQAGRSALGRPLLEGARQLTRDPKHIAAIERLQAAIELEHGSPSTAEEMLLRAATRIEEIDPQQAAAIMLDAAGAAIYAGNAQAQIEVGRRAEAFFGRVPPSFELTVAAGIGRLVGSGAGGEGGAELLRTALERCEASKHPRRYLWAARSAFHLGDASAARRYATREVALARREGSMLLLVSALARIALAEIIDGRLVSARANASEGFTLASETALENEAGYHQALLALIGALLGHSEQARSDATAVFQLARARGLAWQAAVATFALGTLELGEARPNEAIAYFRTLSTTGCLAASTYVSLIAAPSLVEAGVQAARPDVAGAALAHFERWVTTTRSRSNIPLLERSRALLAPPEEAERYFENALSMRAANPTQRAKTELLYGEFLRRVGRRRDARDHLRIAIELFDQIGAAGASNRAASELRATGETLRPRRHTAEHELTPQELQVARFVATGATNKEVAAQLFLSPRTIDSHLRKVFSKLGVTTRGQLARFDLGEPGSLPLARIAPARVRR